MIAIANIARSIFRDYHFNEISELDREALTMYIFNQMVDMWYTDICDNLWRYYISTINWEYITDRFNRDQIRDIITNIRNSDNMNELFGALHPYEQDKFRNIADEVQNWINKNWEGECFNIDIERCRNIWGLNKPNISIEYVCTKNGLRRPEYTGDSEFNYSASDSE